MNLQQEYENQQKWRDWEKYLKHIPLCKDDIVIDIGCSVGSVSHIFSQKLDSVIGIDVSKEFISYCYENRRPNEKFICKDISEFDFDSINQFSGVWASFSLSYLSDPLKLLSSIYRSMDSGGWIALVDVSCFISGNMFINSKHHKAMRDFELASCKSGGYDFNFGAKMSSLLTQAGFKIQYVDDNVTDPELNFSGSATAEIIENWSSRLLRLKGIQNEFADYYPQISKEIFTSLSSKEHDKRGNVKFVVAKKI